MVFHAGSERHWDEKEMWKIYYRGVPKVCYRCLKEGHMGRDCGEDDPLNMETLVTQPEFEAAPVETEQVGEAVAKTFAQVVKDKSFTAREAELLAVRQHAAKVRQEAVDAARQEREKRDEERRRRRKKEKEKENIGPRQFSLERGKTGGYGSDWAASSEEEDDENPSKGGDKTIKRQHSSPFLKERDRDKVSDSPGAVGGDLPLDHQQHSGGGRVGGDDEGRGQGRAGPPGN